MLKARWDMYQPELFRIQQHPAMGGLKCLQPKENDVAGSPLDFRACAAGMSLLGHEQEGEGFRVSVPGTPYWLGAITKPAMSKGDNVNAVEPSNYLSLVSHGNETNSLFTARCFPCPGAPLAPGAWALAVAAIFLAAVLPACVGLLCELPRLRSVEEEEEPTLWPYRRRLSGLPGLLAQLGWLMLIMSVTPLAVWILGDAWPGLNGWYLALGPWGAALLLLVVRPTDPPKVLRFLYTCALLCFSILSIVGPLLVYRWASEGRAHLAIRDLALSVLAVGSLIMLWRAGRRTVLSSSPKSPTVSAAALATFRLVVRVDAAVLGGVWLLDASVRIVLQPTLQTRNPSLWSDVTLGVSFLLVAIIMRASLIFRLQTLPPLNWCPFGTGRSLEQPTLVYRPSPRPSAVEMDSVVPSAPQEHASPQPQPQQQAQQLANGIEEAHAVSNGNHLDTGDSGRSTSTNGVAVVMNPSQGVPTTMRTVSKVWLEGVEPHLCFEGLVLGERLGRGGFSIVCRATTKVCSHPLSLAPPPPFLLLSSSFPPPFLPLDSHSSYAHPSVSFPPFHSKGGEAVAVKLLTCLFVEGDRMLNRLRQEVTAHSSRLRLSPYPLHPHPSLPPFTFTLTPSPSP